MLAKLIRRKNNLRANRFSTALPKETEAQIENPAIKALLSKSRIERHNHDIDMQLAHNDRKVQMLQSEIEGKLNVNKWNSVYQNNNISPVEGLKQSDFKLNDKFNINNKYTFDHSYDYPIHFNKAVKELENSKMWNADMIEDNHFENTIRNGFEYLQIMDQAEKRLLNEDNTKLSEAEVKIVNLPLNSSIRELKRLFNLKSHHIKSIGRDSLNNISCVTLDLKDKASVETFLSTNGHKNYKGNNLKYVSSENFEDERLSNRTIIIENLDSSATESELLLELTKYGKIKQIILPRELSYGKALTTSDVLQYIEAKKHTFGDDFKIEVNEKNGNESTLLTVYEGDNNLSEDLYLNKTKGFDYLKNFTLETFEEIRKLDEEEGIRKLLREKNKLVIETLKNDGDHDDYKAKTEKNDKNEVTNKLWERFDEKEKLEKVFNKLKYTKSHHKVHKVLSKNLDNIYGTNTNLGFAVIEFNSSYEAKKALVGFKSINRFVNTKVDVWSPGKLYKLVPDLKANMIKVIEKNKILNEAMKVNDLNSDDILVSEESHNYPENVKFLRRKQLKQLLQTDIENFIKENYFTDSPNLETKLPKLDELSHHMLKEGRSFGEINEAHELNLLKARVGLAYQKGSYRNDAIQKIKLIVSLQNVI